MSLKPKTIFNVNEDLWLSFAAFSKSKGRTIGETLNFLLEEFNNNEVLKKQIFKKEVRLDGKR